MRLLFAALLATALAAAPPPDAEDCVACHDTIKLEVFRTRAHGGLQCFACHTATKKLPHPEKMPPPNCVRCHDHQGQEYANSVHGMARKKGKDHAPTCMTCHGHAHELLSRKDPGSRVARQNMDATCGKCHDKAHLDKLHTALSKRASRMDLQKMPGKP